MLNAITRLFGAIAAALTFGFSPISEIEPAHLAPAAHSDR